MYASNHFWTHLNSRLKTAGKSQAENLRRVRLKICNDRKKPLWNWRFFSCFCILRPIPGHFQRIFGCFEFFFPCTSNFMGILAVFWMFAAIFSHYVQFQGVSSGILDVCRHIFSLRPISECFKQYFGCFILYFPITSNSVVFGRCFGKFGGLWSGEK